MQTDPSDLGCPLFGITVAHQMSQQIQKGTSTYTYKRKDLKYLYYMYNVPYLSLIC